MFALIEVNFNDLNSNKNFIELIFDVGVQLFEGNVGSFWKGGKC